MRIFALETDVDKLNQSFLSPKEDILIKVRFHWFLFFLRTISGAIVTLVLIALTIGGATLGIPWAIMAPIVVIAWVVLVARSLLRAFIDWQYDELVVTTEKLIVVNQSSIIRQEIRQMNMENLASVSARTQYWGLMPFGQVHFDLKEGTGKVLTLGYIPQAQRVASLISNTMVQFQRRQAS